MMYIQCMCLWMEMLESVMHHQGITADSAALSPNLQVVVDRGNGGDQAELADLAPGAAAEVSSDGDYQICAF